MRIVTSTDGLAHHLSQVDNLTNNDILYFYDVFDEQTVKEIIAEKGKPKYILGDSLSFIDTSVDVPIYTTNLWLESELKHYAITMPEIVQTKYSANFLINKKQINRHLTIKLCEIFNLDVSYTWSGIGRSLDLTTIVNELESMPDSSFISQPERSKLFAPIEIPANWIAYPNNTINDSFIDHYGGNEWSWNNGINDIVSQSAVSLISESVWTQRAIHFSEKTAYSVLGLTFPIWIGGYQQAREWKKIGFDTFEDIIDHSYQSMETLIERCWYAVKLNLDLLQDKNKLSELRQEHIARLRRNRDLLMSNRLQEYNDKIISHWPNDLRENIGPVLNLFR